MADQKRNGKAVFRVVDALDGPHRGRILRLRLIDGAPPTIKALKGARLVATSPDGDVEAAFRVDGFPTFGGRPSDERLARTRRVDVHVVPDDGTDLGAIGLRWRVTASD